MSADDLLIAVSNSLGEGMSPDEIRRHVWWAIEVFADDSLAGDEAGPGAAP